MALEDVFDGAVFHVPLELLNLEANVSCDSQDVEFAELAASSHKGVMERLIFSLFAGGERRQCVASPEKSRARGLKGR